MSLAGVSAVAFDLDWTLCFYSVSVRDGIRRALERLECRGDLLGDLDEAAARYEVVWAEEEAARAPAKRVRERTWVRLLEGQGADDPDLAASLAEEYAAIRMPSVCLFDGVKELLSDLKGAYRLGLLTNGQPDMQWPKIKTLGIEGLFDAIVISGEVGIYKPDRRIFEVLLARLGMEAHRTLYVGDSQEMDVAGAKSAGMRSAWVRRNGEGDPAAVPDVSIGRVDELREVLL
jgi:putative hydrolase of the HAD superfamily